MSPGSFAGRRQRRVGLALVAFATALTLALTAPAAPARNAYVANTDSDTVSVIDSASAQPLGGPIGVGDGPSGIAITPDGSRVYVTNFTSDSVSAIDVATGRAVGDPIAVGDTPRGIAITPDGTRAYVANAMSDSVSVIDTATDEVVGDPIAVGAHPLGIAIAPDGTRAFVANSVSDDVSVIDLAYGRTIGTPIPVGANPLGIAIAPDGRRLYVTDSGADTVSVLDVATGRAVGNPIQVGTFPMGIAITPDGTRAYVGTWGPDSVTVIDTASNATIGGAIPGPLNANPLGIAITPDSMRALVVNWGPGSVSVIDTASDAAVGAPVPVGSGPLQIAIVPNQSPLAALADGAGTAGQPVRFDASGSHDPDGQVARYDWSFGDGQTALDAGPTPTHVYATAGSFRATVTVTDSEGCSTALVFTGQTASCNGAPRASATAAVEVAPAPGGGGPGPPGGGPGPPSGGSPPTGRPSNVVRVGRLLLDRRRGIAKLTIRVPGPGTLRLGGRRVQAVTRRVAAASTVTLTVRPKRTLLAALRRRGELSVQVSIGFRPQGGDARSVSRRLTLLRTTAQAAPGRRSG